MALQRDSRSYRWLVAGVGIVGATALRLLGATWRIRFEGPDPLRSGGPFVGVVWHRNMLLASHLWRDRGVVVLVSRSRDGDLVSAVLARLGFGSGLRGSTTRGSTEALRGATRRLAAGAVVAVLGDGPGGPREQLKPGALAMAAGAGVPLVPVGLAARPALRFRSWDRTVLPAPFARIVCRYGRPEELPKRLAGAELEERRSGVETRMGELSRACAEALDLPEESRDRR